MEVFRYRAFAIWHPTSKILLKAMTDPKKTGDVHVLWKNNVAYCDTYATKDNALLSTVRRLAQVALLRPPV